MRLDSHKSQEYAFCQPSQLLGMQLSESRSQRAFNRPLGASPAIKPQSATGKYEKSSVICVEIEVILPTSNRLYVSSEEVAFVRSIGFCFQRNVTSS